MNAATPSRKPKHWDIHLVRKALASCAFHTLLRRATKRDDPGDVASEESGRFEIYVQPFPGPGQEWQVSTGGGAYLRRKRDGKEIFFLELPEKTLMASEVKPGPTFDVGEPKALFQAQVKWVDFGRQYDASPDGSRFLINTLVAQGGSEPLTVVQNWTARG